MKHGRVLITGGCGFIGTHLAHGCARQGIACVGIGRNPPVRPEDWAGFVQGSVEEAMATGAVELAGFEAVFHLAGSSSVPGSVAAPFNDLARQLLPTARLAEQAGAAARPPRIVFFSSAAVYGEGTADGALIAEETRTAPISPYGVHKLLAEELLLRYACLYRFPLTILRIFSVYGPGLRRQVIWDISRKILGSAGSTGTPAVSLFGTGAETRDFIHVQDLVEAALILGLEAGSTRPEILNVGSGTAVPIAEVAGLIAAILGFAGSCAFQGAPRRGDPACWQADTGKLRRKGFSCVHPFREGLEETVAWIRTQAA